MTALIIANNLPGPLPITVNFKAPLDGPATFVFSGTAWARVDNVPIAVQVLLDGVVIGTAQLYSNGASEHRTLPTQIMETDLDPGLRTITIQAVDSHTATDSNDNFSVSLLY
jgi:hypothetical protein